MEELRNKFIDLFLDFNLNDFLSTLITDIILLLILILVGIVFYYIIKFIYSKTIKKFGSSRKNVFISEFFKSPLNLKTLKLITVIVISSQNEYLKSINQITSIVFTILIAYLIVKTINSILDLINSIYENNNKQAGIKPIKGLINFAKAVVFTIVTIIVIADLINQSPIAILTGLGAMSAVLMLIFKDSILGLVAGFQMSANDLIRIGDWIEMPAHGVDGDVVDVTLTFIKVQNWDKTIVTIPAYLLISESFTNWRSVFRLGGRRIKRSFNIDAESVKVLDEKLFNKLLKVELIQDYLKDKKVEIDTYNQSNNINTEVSVNGRRLTNLGVFRIYLTEYLNKHPDIHKDLLFIVRQLQTESKGIPLEVYAFSKKTAWKLFEGVQADIFDHIYANANYFDLRIYQEPSGHDLKKIK